MLHLDLNTPQLMKHLTLFIITVLLTAAANALDVSVVQLVPARCGLATGVLQAEITGGVPPYTVLWSTGSTNAYITDMSPGTYSVTITDAIGVEVTAEGEVLDVPMVEVAEPLAQVHHPLAHCPGEFPLVELTLHAIGFWGGALYGTPPFTVTGPPSVVSAATLPCVDSACDQDSVIRVTMNAPAGSVQVISWVDANGCPGSSTVVLSEEVVWPTVQFYDVLGACNGASTGRLTVSTSPNNLHYMRFRLLGPDGAQVTGTTLEDDEYLTAALGDRPPGDHLAVLQPRYFGAPTEGACSDTTLITIEDLGPGCGQVNGPVFIDGDADCNMQAGENRIPQAIVEFTPGPYYATTSAQGFYVLNLPLGSYDHQVIHPGVQQECPGPIQVDGDPTEVNEPIGCSSLVALDAHVALASGPARPGFLVTVAVTAVNNTPANTGASTLMLSFDPILSYVGSYPGSPSSVNGNELSWNFNGLGAYVQQTRWVTLQVPPDVDLIGTELMHTLSFTTGNVDDLPANNTVAMYQVITGSFDPNLKAARTSTGLDGGTYFIDQDQWIDYTLHFQNTGTDTAFLVVVTDTLPATLDPATLEVGAGSHAFSWSLTGAGILRFDFPNILLPDSNINELHSHGFVSFRIRPKQPIAPGTVIENIANIYFDFNPPVITEPSVLVAEFSTGLSLPAGESVLVQNDPAQRQVLLAVPSSWSGTGNWKLLTSDGRHVQAGRITGGRTVIPWAGNASGIYLVIVEDQAGKRHAQRINIERP